MTKSNVVISGAYADKRVAVTGAGGFVGSHLAQLLIEAGADVVALDVRPPDDRLEEYHGEFDYVHCDLLDPQGTKNSIREASPDVLFHLAAYAVQPRERDAQLAISINIAGSAAVVEGAAEAGTQIVVQVGTSHEYGGAPEPIRETHPLNPTGIYGASKAAGMIVGRTRAYELGVRWIGLRPFVTFGPREDEDKLVPYIITRAMRGEPVVTTDGSQVRDILYVSDLVHVIALLARTEMSSGEIVNIGTGVGTSLRTLMDSIRQIIPGGDYCFGERNARPDDIPVQIADVSKLGGLLAQWKPSYSTLEAIAETVRFYQERG